MEALMPSDAERVGTILNECGAEFHYEGGQKSKKNAVELLCKFAAEVRRSALEEAANRASCFGGEIKYWDGGNEVAVAIRSLIDKERP